MSGKSNKIIIALFVCLTIFIGLFLGGALLCASGRSNVGMPMMIGGCFTLAPIFGIMLSANE